MTGVLRAAAFTVSCFIRPPLTELAFDLLDGSRVEITVSALLNAGFSGRRADGVAAHIRELKALGVAAPTITPCLHPLPSYLAMQTGEVFASHHRTSGEGEWALIVAGPDERDLLLTAACDHTDRALEAHGVAWSKQAAPDILGTRAWRLTDVADGFDDIELIAWADGREIQHGTLAELLSPTYWLEVLRGRGLAHPGTVLLSGTIPMHRGVNQFAEWWRVELRDRRNGQTIACGYRVTQLPEGIG